MAVSANGTCKCPRCNAILTFVESQPVTIVDGKLNMDDTVAHYRCQFCDSIYRRIVNTDYYQWYEWMRPDKDKESGVRDIQPSRLTPEENGERKCPRCRKALTFIEGQPVRIVDGKLNMEDTEGHYGCDACKSVFRKIANTDYYQWCEK